MNSEIRAELESMAEPAYAEFARRLLPPTAPLLGVRLPKLHRLARTIAKQDAEAYLNCARDDSFEEIMLQGMVIGAMNAPADTVLKHVQHFLPKIDNWSVCDSFCCGLVVAKKEPQAVWDFTVPYLCAEHAYSVRFAIVTMLDHFIDAQHLPQIFGLLAQLHRKEACITAAAGWALAECCAKFPDETFAFLNTAPPDTAVLFKAVQKCRESKRISSDLKVRLSVLAAKYR